MPIYHCESVTDQEMETSNGMTAALLMATAYMMVTLLFFLILQLYKKYWARPEKILEKLRKQGIHGPRRRFPTGNLLEMRKISTSIVSSGADSQTKTVTQNYSSTLFPYFDQWRKDYGSVFIYSTGNQPSLYVSDPDLVREISMCVSLNLGKSTYLQKTQAAMFGNGIIKSNGRKWVRQRKLISPQFFMDKVKGMVDLILEAAMPMLAAWESRIDACSGGDVEFVVDPDLRKFSADVISRACFGSSYSRGNEIFRTLREIQKVVSSRSILFKIPQLRFLPGKDNKDVTKLVQNVRALILKLVRERKQQMARPGSPPQNDLLQSILESKNGDDFVVDNCKNIYFAGHETAAVTATWCLMLLASHPEWQCRARSEAIDLCKDSIPDSQILCKMKTLTMVIHESLRLFPPSAFVSRESLEDISLQSLMVPKGTNIWIPIATLHHDKQIWGEDADEFRPERFANGIHRACNSPHVYMPFGVGARKCIGKHLAMVELKIVLSLILSRFRLSLSPKYKHSPTFSLTIGPEFGVLLLVGKL